jgi:alkyl hydroperoxide reductase subunit D
VQALLDISGSKLTDGDREGAKAASTIMAMNNVYYRTMHFFKDEEFTKKPARLRMTIIGKPGIDKVDFELASLAVSAVAGCKGCVLSHAAEVQKHGVSPDGVQTVFRIAATVNALATAQFID